MDEIVEGSTGVFIEGKQAARLGDKTAHDGVVARGDNSVLIGDRDQGELELAALLGLALSEICGGGPGGPDGGDGADDDGGGSAFA